MIAHIVLFSPKPDLSQAEKRSFAESIVRVIGSNPVIARARVGRHVDVDAGYQRQMGEKTYEFAAVLEFVDRQALVDYLADEAHQALGALFWQCCERSVVSEVEYVDMKVELAVEQLVK